LISPFLSVSDYNWEHMVGQLTRRGWFTLLLVCSDVLDSEFSMCCEEPKNTCI
jgi:hypothetical protein